MKSRQVLAIYHRLPPRARSVAATVQGLWLRFWRHGPRSRRLQHEALERETWSDAQWTAWREERLTRLLHRAATRVPYYRAQWEDRRRRGDRSSWERLEHWPILEKDAMRRQPRAFVADDRNTRLMHRERTSGTTGAPLDLWRSRSTVEQVFAIARLRAATWHGVPARVRWARLGGQLVTPVTQRRPPFWVWNAAMRQLYMSAYHLAPDLIPHYLDALVRYRITTLQGYPSALYALAWGALRLGRTDLTMHVVVTSAEPLPDEQRSVLEAAFQCPVRETYGMAENVAAASECPAGRLHQWPEFGWIEVLNGREPELPGTVGDFVCTGLLNEDMPLIRYRVGDRGAFAPGGRTCPCGRTLPLITGIDGRTADVLVMPDGRRLARFGPVFHGLPIRESQIVQEAIDRFRVVVAPEAGFDDRAACRIMERLRDRAGDVTVSVERVDAVPRTASGKLRSVVCLLDAAERDGVLRRAGAAVG